MNFTPSQLIPQVQIDDAYDKLHAECSKARQCIETITNELVEVRYAANQRIASLEAERDEQRDNFHAAATYVQDLESALAELRVREKKLVHELTATSSDLAAARARIAALEAERDELGATIKTLAANTIQLRDVVTEPFFKTPEEYDNFRSWWSEHVTKRLREKDQRIAALAALVAASENEHPEATCQNCGGANVVWHAPSPIWNKVVRDTNSGSDLMLCPTCFIIRAEKTGVFSTSWHVSPSAPLSDTPYGSELTAARARIATLDTVVLQLETESAEARTRYRARIAALEAAASAMAEALEEMLARYAGAAEDKATAALARWRELQL